LKQGDISETSQNGNLAVSAISSLHITLATTPGDGATHVHITEEAHNVELQSSPDESVTDEVSIHGLDEQQLVNPLGSQPAAELDEDNTHLQNVGPKRRTPSTRSSFPALSYVDEDVDLPTELSQILLDGNVPNYPHILPEQDWLSIISRHSSPTSASIAIDSGLGGWISIGNFLAHFELLDHPQTSIKCPALIEEDFPPSSNTSEVLDSKDLRESFTSNLVNHLYNHRLLLQATLTQRPAQFYCSLDHVQLIFGVYMT
jgi:hypothetical protein